MEKIFYKVKENPLFAGIDVEEFSRLLPCIEGRVRRYKRGEVILMTGEKVNSVGLVAEGGVQVLREDAEGKWNLLTDLRAAEMFGEVFACAGVSHSPVTVVASMQTEILHINYQKIISVCSSACPFHGCLVENMLRLMARKSLQLNQKLELLSKRTTRERLLLYFDQCRGKSTVFTLPFTRTELAAYLCVERSALSAELSRMQKDGLILCQGREVVVRETPQTPPPPL